MVITQRVCDICGDVLPKMDDYRVLRVEFAGYSKEVRIEYCDDCHKRVCPDDALISDQAVLEMARKMFPKYRVVADESPKDCTDDYWLDEEDTVDLPSDYGVIRTSAIGHHESKIDELVKQSNEILSKIRNTTEGGGRP